VKSRENIIDGVDRNGRLWDGVYGRCFVLVNGGDVIIIKE